MVMRMCSGVPAGACAGRQVMDWVATSRDRNGIINFSMIGHAGANHNGPIGLASCKLSAMGKAAASRAIRTGVTALGICFGIILLWRLVSIGVAVYFTATH